MTTNESTQEEHPWGFEHDPSPCHEAIVTVKARDLFRGDGMMWALLDKIRRALGMASMAEERGPDPDYASSYERGVRDGARNAGSPNIGGVNGNSKILTALVALNTALLVGIGTWLLATVSRHDREIAVLECQMSPTCTQAVIRGGRP
jgi:hypothetical protein